MKNLRCVRPSCAREAACGGHFSSHPYVKTGEVRRGQLGVQIQPITSDIAQSLDLKEVRGVIVSSVVPGSAGARAGIRQGDVVKQVNRQSVRSAADLSNALGRSGNRPALLLLNRRGNTTFLTVRPRQWER